MIDVNIIHLIRGGKMRYQVELKILNIYKIKYIRNRLYISQFQMKLFILIKVIVHYRNTNKC